MCRPLRTRLLLKVFVYKTLYLVEVFRADTAIDIISFRFGYSRMVTRRIVTSIHEEYVAC